MPLRKSALARALSPGRSVLHGLHPPPAQPLAQRSPPQANVVVADGDPDGLRRADEANQLAPAGDGGVEQVALEQLVVLRGHQDDDGRVLAALRLVDRAGVGVHQLVELGQIVLHALPVVIHEQHLLLGIPTSPLNTALS